MHTHTHTHFTLESEALLHEKTASLGLGHVVEAQKSLFSKGAQRSCPCGDGLDTKKHDKHKRIHRKSPVPALFSPL